MNADKRKWHLRSSGSICVPVRPTLKAPALLLLLASYVLARAVLGALLNPPLNGPDEAGHLQHLRTLLETGGRQVTGVESRQPPTYYVLAALPWLAAQDKGSATQLFFIRLPGAPAGMITLAAAWVAAGFVWPGRRALAVAAATVATLAPGYLFLLASANNDPLAAGLAALAVVAALRLWQRGARGETPAYASVQSGCRGGLP